MKKILTVLASSLLLLWACTENPTKEKKQWPYKFAYVKGEVYVNDNPVSLDMTLRESDVIITRKNSYATVMFGDSATLTIKPVSKVYLTHVSAGNTEIFQEVGRTFSKVKKGESYAIKTPTVVAGVRGTSFEVASSEGSTTIQLLEGKVEAKSPKSTVVIDSGQKVTAYYNTPLKPVEMTQKEVENLKVVSNLQSEMAKGDNTNQEVSKVIEKVENNDHPPLVRPAKKTMTLEQIKKTYGRIAKITTKSGQEFTGYFSQKGGTMQIITPNGTVFVDVGRVAKVVPLP